MKHSFLLDVMVLYHAIKEVDERGNPDQTCADLIRLIGENCHTVRADGDLVERYWRHIKDLFKAPPLQTQTSLFITDILANAAKLVVDRSTPPELPAGVRIPPEDVYVVRAALISRPIVVTSEERLLTAINAQPVLGLKAISPIQALVLAGDK